MKSHKLNENNACPTCGKILDTATGANSESAPKPGDVSVCGYCTEFLRFDENMRHCKLTDDEWVDLPLQHRKALAAGRAILQKRLKRTSRSELDDKAICDVLESKPYTLL